MTTPAQIAAAETALAQLDPLMAELIAAHGSLNPIRRGTYFGNLTRSIVAQQISVAAARTILGRLTNATDLDPARILALSLENLRTLGLSRSKGGYIHDLAEHFVRDAAVFDHLERLSDDEVIVELIRIKGIGIWTAQMFLMFTLGRLDVFAPDDVGLQRAIQRAYGLGTVPPRAELNQFADRWRPYRTVAAWHLWHSLDNAPA